MHECCPHATVKPKLRAWRANDERKIPRGLISDEKGIDKIGKEGGRGGGRLHPDLTFV